MMCYEKVNRFHCYTSGQFFSLFDSLFVVTR